VRVLLHTKSTLVWVSEKEFITGYLMGTIVVGRSEEDQLWAELPGMHLKATL